MTVSSSTAPIVIKIGGSTLGAGDTTLEDITTLHRRGQRIVVVHGGGPAISAWLAKLQVPTRFAGGLRITDAATLDVAVAVLAGLINKQLVATLNALGAPAIGLSGADGRMLPAQYEDEALGYVGRVLRVDAAPLEAIMGAGFVPVVAPLALLAGDAGLEDQEGEKRQAQLLNVNADTAAGEIAFALRAARLVFLTDVEGVRDAEGQMIGRLNAGSAEELLNAGVIGGGMIPKVTAALRASQAGTNAIILDGRTPQRLIEALTEHPPGTVIEGLEAGFVNSAQL